MVYRDILFLYDQKTFQILFQISVPRIKGAYFERDHVITCGFQHVTLHDMRTRTSSTTTVQKDSLSTNSFCSLAAVNTREVYLGTEDGSVCCLDLSTSRKIWSKKKHKYSLSVRYTFERNYLVMS